MQIRNASKFMKTFLKKLLSFLRGNRSGKRQWNDFRSSRFDQVSNPEVASRFVSELADDTLYGNVSWKCFYNTDGGVPSVAFDSVNATNLVRCYRIGAGTDVCGIIMWKNGEKILISDSWKQVKRLYKMLRKTLDDNNPIVVSMEKCSL